MAKNSSENQEEKTPTEQAQSSSSETSTTGEKKRFQKIRENKPLFGTLIVAGLIGLSALGVGAYSALNDSDDSDETEIVSEDRGDEDRQGIVEEGNSESGNGSEEDSEDSNNGEENEDSNENESDNEDSERSEDSDEDNEDGEESETDIEDNSDENSDENEDSEDEDGSREEEEDNNDSEESETDKEQSSTDQNGNVNANGAVATVRGGHSQSGANKSAENIAEIARTGIWKATDYKKGDITSSPYEVRQGDTLWEIAEGFYGDGFMWTQILNANSSQIGFLPDGSQALIFPGTQLVLPR